MTESDAIQLANELDRSDPLRSFRDEFVIDDPDLIYLDGNSLGRLPKAAIEIGRKTIEDQWGSRLVRGWPEGWIELPSRIGGKIATLLGARANEVLLCDSTSIDLFKVVMAALELSPTRSRIVTDDSNFPSDVYVLQSCARLTGKRLDVVPSDEISAYIDEQTGLVALSHVAFKSGRIHPMAEITSQAHSVGALILWDLCHSVGALPVTLNLHDVDLAVGCTYKYLCGGPGSPAFLYVKRELQPRLSNPVGGWFGHEAPFEFNLNYSPADGMRRFMSGTPPIVSMALIEAGVNLVLRAGIDRIRAKSIEQTDFLIDLFREFLAPLGMRLQSPTDSKDRGSHVSLSHDAGFQIDQALITEARVVPDFRHPDTIRFGISPLYTTYQDLLQAVNRTRTIIESRAFEKYPVKSLGVT